MIYSSDLKPVLKEWKDRLNHSSNDTSYNIALSECINDLENTIGGAIAQQVISDNYYS